MEQVKTNHRPDLLPTRCVTLAKPLPLSGPLLPLSEGSDL